MFSYQRYETVLNITHWIITLLSHCTCIKNTTSAVNFYLCHSTFVFGFEHPPSTVSYPHSNHLRVLLIHPLSTVHNSDKTVHICDPWLNVFGTGSTSFDACYHNMTIRLFLLLPTYMYIIVLMAQQSDNNDEHTCKLMLRLHMAACTCLCPTSKLSFMLRWTESSTIVTGFAL